MGKIIIFMMMMICLFCIPLNAFSNNLKVNVDLSKLDETTRNVVINAVKDTSPKAIMNNITDDLDVQKIKEYANIFTTTINTICKDLGVTVNEFIKTPVGIGAGILIVYNYGGGEVFATVFQVIVLTSVMLIFFPLLYFIFFRELFGTKQILQKEFDNEKIYETVSKIEYWDNNKEEKIVTIIISFIMFFFIEIIFLWNIV